MYMIAEVSQYVAVASFSEAWIEISNTYLIVDADKNVASFSEAWIEIHKNTKLVVLKESPPFRRRGLKSCGRCTKRCGFTSPPFRRRGLKFVLSVVLHWLSVSPPFRRRGLKFF